MSDDQAQAYPLQWPQGRTRAGVRERARFHVRRSHPSEGGSYNYTSRDEIPIGRARDAVIDELVRLGARDVVISSNIRLRLDGLMYAGAKPDGGDPGVAVYFRFRGGRLAFACDRWDRVADNLWSIAKTIEALRGIERWGTGEMVAAALKGFRALAPPVRPWRMVFGYGSETKPLLTDVEKRYRERASAEHPDRGGDPGRMAELNAARDDARSELES